ncbi:signal transduction superfamily protein with modified HD-GYP domain [Thalassotalea insulae]|uniref:Signal transduction superfamily protein with modified HD-GYP domain n=1 Tax=Thalassotalea insulae TaxID=2056778 RepID=A0ABQ6GXS9_9GAMM|nr:HDOD domain-containing protein [Thalassotalea insulae]GLX79330.1 signal transduction superfamily protein with modified HD-GYP domain [Thalassotalea insulae]
MGTENALYTILVEKIKQEALVLPTLPEIALKVREAADDPEVNLAHMSEIIAHDPALSMGILKVANSAMLGRSIKVETVNQAVTRIGLRQIKSIATAMALEQVFVSENEIVAMYLDKSWKKTVDVASVAIALMTFYLKEVKHSPLMLDTLTLAALVHNIGVLPILTEAENHPDVFANPTFIQQAIIKLSSKVGAEISKAWGLSDELCEIIHRWSDLTVLPTQVHYLDFIRAGAIYHNIFKNESTKDVLLKNYVGKGILPEIDFMESGECKDVAADIKQMFS